MPRTISGRSMQSLMPFLPGRTQDQLKGIEGISNLGHKHNTVAECSDTVKWRLRNAMSILVPAVLDMVKGGNPDTDGMLLLLNGHLHTMLPKGDCIAEVTSNSSSALADSIFSKFATAYKALRVVLYCIVL